ncbi:MAG TPA: fatty acid desaturase [Acetobacteraceae bacterium]|nr:fatty acid desaturase [Acetobacteraceae bacterium]
MQATLSSGDIKRLSVRSDAAGLRFLAAHLAAILAAGAAVVALRGTWLVWPAMAVLGVLEVALFAPLHETTHRTPFRSGWLNRAVGWVAGFVLVLPPEGFRLFHLAHHRHTQDAARDPELIGAKALTWRRYLWLLTGLPYWGAQVSSLLRIAWGRADAPWLPPAARPAVVREARVYLALYAVVAAAGVLTFPFVPLLWAGPVLLGQPVLRAVLLAEHTGCPLGDDGLANTRTTLTDRFVSLLFWNANFHIEHHLLPGVPFHALPRLHALVARDLRTVAPGYRAAHRAIRQGLS